MKLSVIIPCYNERQTINLVVKKLLKLKITLEIIIVDDCSDDGTKELIKKKIEKKVNKVIYHNSNLGKGSCIISAKKFATGDYIIIQDADLEYNPEDFYLFLNYLNKHKVDVLYGSRFKGLSISEAEKRFLNRFRIFGNKLLTLFSNILNFQKLTDAHTCYKMFSKKVFKNLYLKDRGFTFCPEVNTKLSKMGINIYEIPISYKARNFSEGKKIKFIDFFHAVFCIVKYRFFYSYFK